jgi:hypothetical protein
MITYYFLKMIRVKCVFTLSLIFSVLGGNIELKQYDIDSQAVDLVWCGHNRETVFVQTELNSLYRSDDKGLSWKKLNNILINKGKDQLDENENEV